MTTESSRVEETPPGTPDREPGRASILPGAIGRVFRVPAASVIIATLVLTGVIGAFHPDFLQVSQLTQILQSSVYVGLLAVGMAYLISMREIDLSVGSEFGLCLVTGALLMLHGVTPWLAALISVALGGLLGAINATVVTYVRIPTIVTTLATLSVYRGLAVAATGGQQVTGLPLGNSFFTVLGGDYVLDIPVSVLVMIAIAVPLGLVLHHTPFGYRVLAVGSNPEAAQFSGISVTRVRTQVLIMLGVLAGIAGCLGLAFFTSGDPNNGTGFELQAIAAAVIGGTPLRGGTASILGAVTGAVLLNVVASGLTYFSVPANWSDFATGVVILVAVGLDSFIRNRQGRSSTRLTL